MDEFLSGTWDTDTDDLSSEASFSQTPAKRPSPKVKKMKKAVEAPQKEMKQ